MDNILRVIPNFRVIEKIRDDDFVDQMHHFITVYILSFAGVFIGVKELAMEPIDCWADFTTWRFSQKHINTYCWLHEIYQYPNDSNRSQMPYTIVPGMPTPPESAMESDKLKKINLFKGITVILFIQAFAFKLPSIVWKSLNGHSGAKLKNMVMMINDSNFDFQSARVIFNKVAEFLETWLVTMRHRCGFQTQKVVFTLGRRRDYLFTIYLMTKLLFLVNVTLQFILLSKFLKLDYIHYGISIIMSYPDRLEDHSFPRLGICHFQEAGEAHWVQCLLSTLVILEYILLFIWFWFLVLLIVTTINLCVWIKRALVERDSIQFVSKYMAGVDSCGFEIDDEAGQVKPFVTNYLGKDGIFILRILATNTNDIAMVHLTRNLWERYTKNEDHNCKKLRKSLDNENNK